LPKSEEDLEKIHQERLALQKKISTFAVGY